MPHQPIPSPVITAPVDPSWNSGLKTLPKRRRCRSENRWDIENFKVLAEKRPSGSPARVSEADAWPAGVKVLGDRHAETAPQNIRPTEVADEWHGVKKTIDNPPTKLDTKETWAKENFKVLPSDVASAASGAARRSRSAEMSYRTTSPTTATAPAAVVPPTRPYSPTRLYHVTIPADGSWASENFKVLDTYDRNAPHLFHHYATQSLTKVPQFERDDYWSSGFKTVEKHRPILQPHGWSVDNMKALDPYRRRYVVSGTGWDSGLFKTLPREGRDYRIHTAWTEARKAFSPEEDHPGRRTYVNAGTGWDSGLKPIPAARPRSISNLDHWDAENRKTLPWWYITAGGHRQEYRRHVMGPRWNDIANFQHGLFHY